jgi:hypothetical protein
VSNILRGCFYENVDKKSFYKEVGLMILFLIEVIDLIIADMCECAVLTI